MARKDAKVAKKNLDPDAQEKAKLNAVREAAQYSFPTADIDQMLKEIERGYL